MPPKSRKQELAKKRKAMIDAMTPLLLLPSFQTWIETLRNTKDYEVQYWVDSETVKNERESLVAKGTIRAYLAIIQDYEQQRESLERQLEAQAAEQRAGK